MRVELTQRYYVGDASFNNFTDALEEELGLWIMDQTAETPTFEDVIRIICAKPNQVISILSQNEDPLVATDTLAGDVG